MKRRNREWVIARLCAKYMPELKPLWRPPRDDDAIISELEHLVHEVADRLHLEVEFSDCRHEISSMVQAWFFRRKPAFRIADNPGSFAALNVMFSKLAPFYCLNEVKVNKPTPEDGFSYALSAWGLERVDLINTEAVAALADEVDLQLEFEGYARLKKSVLGGQLPKGVWIDTEMSYRYNFINKVWVQRRFDALFQWRV